MNDDLRETSRVQPPAEALSVECVAQALLPTDFGEFQIYAYRSRSSEEEFVAVVKGQPKPSSPCLVRIHSQCLTGDVFHSLRCDCGRQLEAALQLIEDECCGVIIYQQQEGRGIGIVNKIRAYALQDEGLDTVEANVSLGFLPDARTYTQCAEILLDLGVRLVRFMSNNPEKIRALELAGLTVVERVTLSVEPHSSFVSYLRTKRDKMGHLIGEELLD